MKKQTCVQRIDIRNIHLSKILSTLDKNGSPFILLDKGKGVATTLSDINNVIHHNMRNDIF